MHEVNRIDRLSLANSSIRAKPNKMYQYLSATILVFISVLAALLILSDDSNSMSLSIVAVGIIFSAPAIFFFFWTNKEKFDEIADETKSEHQLKEIYETIFGSKIRRK